MNMEGSSPDSTSASPAVRPAPGSPLAPRPPDAARAVALPGMMQQLIDDLPEEIAVLDEKCVILAVNRAWWKTVEEHGYLLASLGHNYRDFCASAAADGYQPAADALAALDDISSGRRGFWQLVYNAGARWNGHDFQICFHRIMHGDQPFILVTRFDLTEILELRRLKREIGDSVTRGQDAERQRLARDLHDSTSQLLAAAGLLAGRLKHHSVNEQILGVAEELQQLLAEAQREIRLISYLGHPPAVEKMGLSGALKSLVEGFGRRAGLRTAFEVLGEPIPVPPASEGALYRTAQEALANVHRHAFAARVRVLLCFRRSIIHLVVADDGIGISREAFAELEGAGVGLASMRSRLAEIKGRLSVRVLSPGTAILASVPGEG